MKRLIFAVLVVLLAVPAFAEFPPVPVGAVTFTALRGPDEAVLTIWAQNGELYFHLSPVVIPFYLGSAYFDFIQDGFNYDGLKFEAANGAEFHGQDIYTTQTFRVFYYASEPWIDCTRPFTIIFNGELTREIVPLDTTTLIPDSGIWKSGDGLLSMYLQKYDTGSCAIVITMGDTVYTAFLDPDYTDGISVSTDVDGRGYSLSLALDDTDSGTLTATLSGYGNITRPVSLSFSGK